MTAEHARGDDPLAEGWAALAEGAWERARLRFDQALSGRETGEALEGLGWAGYCLDDEALTFDARERAYRVYRASGDERSAGRIAAWLASDCLEFRGEPAVANGWLQRAHRLLDGLEPGADHGWLALHEGAIELGMHEDTAAARDRGAQAAELGRRCGVPELEMLGLGLEGRALVSEGEVEQGMRRLDEASATALAGDVSLLACAAWACCYLLAACERVRDYERAAQWCVRVAEFCDRYGLVLYRGVCRAHYAGVLTGLGRWVEAEGELTVAEQTLAASRLPMTGDALARLGELRRRQGRVFEAEELFARCEGHPLSLVGRASLALDDDRPEEAVELVDRYLRRFPGSHMVERCAGLEIAVRAKVRSGDEASARQALEELDEIANRVATGALRAAAFAAKGVVLAAVGDHDDARRSFEDADDLFSASGATFDAARVKVELARTLGALDREAVAHREIEAALATFRRLGANRDVARAEAMLTRAPAWQMPDGPLAELSNRELEVLALLAEGLTNREIGDRLVISEHTAHRHVSNILGKLGVASRSAAASLAGRHGVEPPDAR